MKSQPQLRRSSRVAAGPAARPSKKSDALRVLFALVFILFASIASRDHETPDKIAENIQDAREVVAEQATPQKRTHVRDEKRKMPEVPYFSRINGSI